MQLSWLCFASILPLFCLYFTSSLDETWTTCNIYVQLRALWFRTEEECRSTECTASFTAEILVIFLNRAYDLRYFILSSHISHMNHRRNDNVKTKAVRLLTKWQRSGCGKRCHNWKYPTFYWSQWNSSLKHAWMIASRSTLSVRRYARSPWLLTGCLLLDLLVHLPSILHWSVNPKVQTPEFIPYRSEARRRHKNIFLHIGKLLQILALTSLCLMCVAMVVASFHTCTIG